MGLLRLNLLIAVFLSTSSVFGADGEHYLCTTRPIAKSLEEIYPNVLDIRIAASDAVRIVFKDALTSRRGTPLRDVRYIWGSGGYTEKRWSARGTLNDIDYDVYYKQTSKTKKVLMYADRDLKRHYTCKSVP